MKTILFMVLLSFFSKSNAQFYNNTSEISLKDNQINPTNKNDFFLINNSLFEILLKKNDIKLIEDNFIGIWLKDDKSQKIEIYKIENSYYGKLLSDENTKENEIVLIQMIKKNSKVLYGGTFYDVSKKTEYEVKLKLINNNKLLFTGYYGIFNLKSVWNKCVN